MKEAIPIFVCCIKLFIWVVKTSSTFFILRGRGMYYHVFPQVCNYNYDLMSL